MSSCPCGSQQPFARCCQPLLHGDRQAENAEQLMRSRYTAYHQRQYDYLVDTHHPSRRTADEAEQIKAWGDATRWLKLEVRQTQDGGPHDDAGSVSFTAWFLEGGKLHSLQEHSRFIRDTGRWYYLDGDSQLSIHKIGRNDACPCGSGRKFKRCCQTADTLRQRA